VSRLSNIFGRVFEALAVAAALLLIAPGLRSTLIGLTVLAPVALRQIIAWRTSRSAAA